MCVCVCVCNLEIYLEICSTVNGSNRPARFGPGQSLHDWQVERLGHLLTPTRLNAQILEYVNFTFDTDLGRKQEICLHTEVAEMNEPSF